jgi:ABC-type multidrug transport system fused ATPase/permease subunit
VGFFSWTLSFLRPYRTRAIVIIFCALAEIGLAALAPWPLKVLVDYVLSDTPLPAGFANVLPPLLTDTPTYFLIAAVFAGFAVQLGGELTRVAHTQMQVDMGQGIVYRLREQLLEHLQALPLRHHITARTADSVYRLDADAYCVDDLLIGGLFPMILAGINLGLMFAVLLSLDPTLALLSLSVAPFIYLCLRHHAGTMTDHAERVKSLESRLVERAYEVLSSIAAVKSFTRERHELQRFARAGDETRQARLDLTWQESVFSASVTAITLAGTALVLGIGGLHVLTGELTVGSLLVVVAYLAAVYDPISEIARTTGSLQQALVSGRRVREILALTPEPHDRPGATDASQLVGHIEFRDVDFAYDENRVILQNISFNAHPDTLIALVGPTGAGKTTLANLIPRLYTPLRGHVRIDGVDISDYALRSLRDQIALVPQQPVLFAGTIADNIRYGRLDASAAEVETAARTARVDEFVRRLPQGYATDVAEAGATLSGGERQRIGIARAVLKNAPILILDEPTSALDALSEEAVFDALRQLRAGRTTLVIAHRLSTIRDANQILVLNAGRIVARGTHPELLTSTSLYREMCARLAVGWTPQPSQASVDELLQDLVEPPEQMPNPISDS